MNSQPLSVEIPPSLIDEIAARVAEQLQPAGPEPWIGVEEAAEHLACPKSRIYELVRRQDSTRLPHCKEGSRLLFRRTDLDRYLEGPPR